MKNKNNDEGDKGMAARRMFAKSIVQSSRFLKMPVSSRELYFQLGMSADDDGIVEAWNVMRVINATEDDLRVLVSKGYVNVLNNEDMIAYLIDWKTNNSIRSDRKHDSIYKDLLLEVMGDMEEERLPEKPKAPKKPKVVDAVEVKEVVYADAPAIPLNDGTEWKITQELFEEFSKAYPALDISHELSQMRVWCLSCPSNRKTQKGVSRFINGWLNRSQNSASKNKYNKGSDSAYDNIVV